MNFFDDNFKKPVTTDRFGLCDRQNATMAYIDDSNNGDWIATVENRLRKKILFYPIDFRLNFILPNGNKDYHCDCMLFVEACKKLIFVELKSCEKNGPVIVNGKTIEPFWLDKAILQLKSTIHYFDVHHKSESDKLKKKHAYAANKARPCFNAVDATVLDEFKKTTKFRLLTTNTILIE